MSKNTIGILIVIIIILVTAFFIFGSDTTEAPATATNGVNTAPESEERVAEINTVPTPESEDTIEVEVTSETEAATVSEISELAEVENVTDTNTAGVYTDYDPSLLANAESGTVILFFHAAWCPSCRALDTNISGNLTTIPGDVTILKLDYDSETELKKKYGVVRQHTLVQVDANGNEIKKLNGLTNTLDQVLNKI